MLEDRDYMREPDYRSGNIWGWSATNCLLAVFALIFVVEVAVSPYWRQLIPGNRFCLDYFALSPEGLFHWRIWQLLTYQFMHASLVHLVGNGLVIFIFGREMEAILGWKKYLALFFSSGVVGGIFQAGVAMLWPEYFGGPVVGASAGAFGLVAAFAATYPDRELYLLVLYIIPVRMRAKTLLIMFGVLALLGVVFSESVLGGGVANAAHLGGMFMGVFYVRQIQQGRWFQLRNPLRRSQPRPYMVARAAQSKPWREASGGMGEPNDEQFMKNEVDPILDKISAQGIQSLTARERQILEKARSKMGKS